MNRRKIIQLLGLGGLATAAGAQAHAGTSSSGGAGRTVTMIESVAALRAYEPVLDGQEVELVGHTEAGIGGGVFYFDASDTTSKDNNGTVLISYAGKRWKRRLDGFVTPEMFGALESDDDSSLAIRRALSTGGNVIWNGNYKTMQKIAIYAEKDLYISGTGSLTESPDFVEPHYIDGSHATLYLRAMKPVNIVVDGLRFFGRRSDHYNWHNYRDSLFIMNAASATIRNCYSYNSSSLGFQLSGCGAVRVHDNEIITPMFHPVYVKHSQDVMITNNKLEGIGTQASTDTSIGGIGILAFNCVDINISGNMIDNMSDTGTKTEGCVNVIYDNNVVTRSGKDGIKIQGLLKQKNKPVRAVISNNVVKDLYPTRSDGSTLVQVSHTQHVTVTGNVISNHTEANRYGVRIFNLGGDQVGNAGFVVINNNEVDRCSDRETGYESIIVVGVYDDAQHYMINDNMCYAGIYNSGCGVCTINGNVVGVAENRPLDSESMGIRSDSRSNVIQNNTVRNFGIGIVVSVDDPSDGTCSANIVGNTLENITHQLFDVGSRRSATNTMSTVINDNACINFDLITGWEAIRLRVGGVDMDTVSIVGNTFIGGYKTLVGFIGYSEPEVIGSYAVSSNIEESTDSGYRQSHFVDKCKRVVGDYAQYYEAPSADKSYRRGDIVYNSAPAIGRDVGFQCIDASTQQWASIGKIQS